MSFPDVLSHFAINFQISSEWESVKIAPGLEKQHCVVGNKQKQKSHTTNAGRAWSNYSKLLGQSPPKNKDFRHTPPRTQSGFSLSTTGVAVRRVLFEIVCSRQWWCSLLFLFARKAEFISLCLKGEIDTECFVVWCKSRAASLLKDFEQNLQSKFCATLCFFSFACSFNCSAQEPLSSCFLSDMSDWMHVTLTVRPNRTPKNRIFQKKPPQGLTYM